VELSNENARRHGVLGRCEFRLGDAFAEAAPLCDLLVSNPPYIAARDRDSLEPEVIDHDPEVALFSGEEGLDAIASLAKWGLDALADGGWLAFEHGHDQAESAAAMLKQAGWSSIAHHRDLAGHDRVTVARRD
jgi:release factor glutamine methyltransferase